MRLVRPRAAARYDGTSGAGAAARGRVHHKRNFEELTRCASVSGARSVAREGTMAAPVPAAAAAKPSSAALTADLRKVLDELGVFETEQQEKQR